MKAEINRFKKSIYFENTLAIEYAMAIMQAA
jgi:hypothetical protein